MNKPQATIADVAAEQMGIREISPNRAPEIAKFWTATNYPDGMMNREPWCSALVAWCVQEAARRNPLISLPIPPRFAAVKDWLPWALDPKTGCTVFKPRDGLYFPEAGDIVIFKISHMAIVRAGFTDPIVPTYEGNTNNEGGREGNVSCSKTRSLNFCAAFIRLPAVGKPVGGAA